MTSGWIYILTNPSLQKDLLKIGKTSISPEQRARQLFSTGNPAEFHVAYEVKVGNMDLAEKLIHERLNQFRYNTTREFFNIPLKQSIPIVDNVAKSVGIIEADRFLTDAPKLSPLTDYTKRRGKWTDEHWEFVIKKKKDGNKNKVIIQELIDKYGCVYGSAKSFVGSISCCINALEGRSNKKDGIVFQYAQYLMGNIKKCPKSSDNASMRYVDKVYSLMKKFSYL